MTLHRDRLLLSLKQTRPFVAPAVGRAYAELGWIDWDDIPRRPINTKAAAATGSNLKPPH